MEPNDAVGLCADAVIPGSLVVPVLGNDHDNSSKRNLNLFAFALINTSTELPRLKAKDTIHCEGDNNLAKGQKGM